MNRNESKTALNRIRSTPWLFLSLRIVHTLAWWDSHYEIQTRAGGSMNRFGRVRGTSAIGATVVQPSFSVCHNRRVCEIFCHKLTPPIVTVCPHRWLSQSSSSQSRAIYAYLTNLLYLPQGLRLTEPLRRTLRVVVCQVSRPSIWNGRRCAAADIALQ